jgi:hypothetical protein
MRRAEEDDTSNTSVKIFCLLLEDAYSLFCQLLTHNVRNASGLTSATTVPPKLCAIKMSDRGLLRAIARNATKSSLE